MGFGLCGQPKVSKTVNNILQAVHGGDIYDGFQPLPEKLSGWGGDDPIFDQLIGEVKPKVVVEVGSWLGMSAIKMAKACQSQGIGAAVICVDTWLGSEEHVLNARDVLAPKHGYPTFYYQFLSNVMHAGVQDIVVPLPTASIGASVILSLLSIKAGMIYIDANHQTSAVLADMTAFWPMVEDGGVMFGHDISFPSVATAVDQFCSVNKTTRTTVRDFWVIRKQQ